MYRVKYTSDNACIDQLECEVRQWVDVREMSEWKRLAAAAAAGFTYLRNRLTGNLPPGQTNFDCSHMYEVLRVVQAFNPSWADEHLDATLVDALAVGVKPLAKMAGALQRELAAYKVAVRGAKIDHTECKNNHAFTEGVLHWWKVHAASFRRGPRQRGYHR